MCRDTRAPCRIVSPWPWVEKAAFQGPYWDNWGGADIKYRSYNIFAPVLNSFGVVTLLCLCRRSSLLLKMPLKYLGLRVTMSATNFSRVQKNRQHIGITQTHVHMGERPKEARCANMSTNDVWR